MDYLTDLPVRPANLSGDKYNAKNEAHSFI